MTEPMAPASGGSRVQAALYLCRWLIAPFLLGLMLALLLLMWRFFADLYELTLQVPRGSWHDLVVGVLNLVDIVLTAQLVMIVAFSGFENYVRRLDASASDSWPSGLINVDFAALKQKLLGSIAGIAAVDALAWYLDLEKVTDTAKLGWAIAFPLMLVVATALLALADGLAGRSRK